MAGPWNAIQGYEAWLIGALVAGSVWLSLHLVFASQPERPKKKSPSRPVPITRETLASYVTSSPVLLQIEVELATGLGLDVSTDVGDLAWAEEKARALGIKDTAGLDKLLHDNEHLILRFASRFRWETIRRGTALRLLFQIVGASLGPEKYRQITGELKHPSESPELVLRAYQAVVGTPAST